MNRGLIYLVLVLPSIWAFCQKRSWTEHGIADRECFYGFFAGFPQVEYRWMKDGVFLSDFSSEHFYKIQSVARSDAGDYRCYAKNSVGTIISEKIKLTVACKYYALFPPGRSGKRSSQRRLLIGFFTFFDQNMHTNLALIRLFWP